MNYDPIDRSIDRYLDDEERDEEAIEEAKIAQAEMDME